MAHVRVAALALLLLPAGLRAQAAMTGDTAPPPAIALTGQGTIASDYRFRGLSRSNKRFAIQGGAEAALLSGLYGGAWGSSIDDYVAHGAAAEIHLYGGARRTFGGIALDAGLLYDWFADNGRAPTDFFEPYVTASHTLGPVTLKLGGNFAWGQRGLAAGGRSRAGGAYGHAELVGAVPGTGFTLTGHVGHSFVANRITGDAHYTDWSLGAAYNWRRVTLGATYVDTDRRLFSYPLGDGPNRDIAKAGLVGSVGLAF